MKSILDVTKCLSGSWAEIVEEWYSFIKNKNKNPLELKERRFVADVSKIDGSLVRNLCPS